MEEKINDLIPAEELLKLTKNFKKSKNVANAKINKNSKSLHQIKKNTNIKNNEKTLKNLQSFLEDDRLSQFNNKPSSFDMRNLGNFLPSEDTLASNVNELGLVSDYYADNFNLSNSRSSSASSEKPNNSSKLSSNASLKNSKQATNNNNSPNNVSKNHVEEENLPKNTNGKIIPPNMTKNLLCLMYHELFVNPSTSQYLPPSYFIRFMKGVFIFPWPFSLEIIITHFEENPCFFWGFILEPKVIH